MMKQTGNILIQMVMDAEETKALPYSWHLVWPSSLDQPFVCVLVQWSSEESYDEYHFPINFETE